MLDSTNRLLKVFLCHSSGDKPVVRELYRKLNDESWLDVWLDEMKLLPGQVWDLEIEKAVEGADIVLACLSTHSVDKEGYVQKELRFVLNIADEKPEGSIFVIPLRLDDCVVPRRLRRWQWVDYFPESQKLFAYTRLIESFRARALKLGIFDNKSKTEPIQKPVTNISSEPLPQKSFDAVRKVIKPLPRRKLPQSFVEQFKKYESEQLHRGLYLA